MEIGHQDALVKTSTALKAIFPTQPPELIGLHLES